MNDPTKNVTGELLAIPLVQAPTYSVQEIAEFMKDHLQPQLIEVEADGIKAQLLVTRDGEGQIVIDEALSHVDELRTAPKRIKGVSRITDLESFIAHAKRFADEDSALFAHRDQPRLLAVYDYHRPATGDEPAKGGNQARFACHRAEYSFPLDDAWLAWTSTNAKPMSQALFAEFLENRVADVLDPVTSLEKTRSLQDKLLCKFAGPSRLLELARGMSVRVDSIVASKQDLQSGESTIRFETTHSDDRGAPLDVPGAFLIAVPVFRAGAPYQLAARLRYRIKEGKITWWFDLYRVVESFDDAFREACDRASKETELPLFYGLPEA